MRISEVIRLYENVVDFGVSEQDHLDVFPRLAGYRRDLLRRFAGTKTSDDFSDNSLRDKSSVTDFWQKFNPSPRTATKLYSFFLWTANADLL